MQIIIKKYNLTYFDEVKSFNNYEILYSLVW